MKANATRTFIIAIASEKELRELRTDFVSKQATDFQSFFVVGWSACLQLPMTERLGFLSEEGGRTKSGHVPLVISW